MSRPFLSALKRYGPILLAGALFAMGIYALVHLLRPVHPGDTLNARSTVVSARASAKRPRFGVITWRTEGLNQNEELVLSYERTNLVQRRRADA